MCYNAPKVGTQPGGGKVNIFELQLTQNQKYEYIAEFGQYRAVYKYGK